jgi:hypothetical protein
MPKRNRDSDNSASAASGSAEPAADGAASVGPSSKRAKKNEGSSAAPSVTSSTSARPRRAAAEAAVQNIQAQIEAENSAASIGYITSSASSASSSGAAATSGDASTSASRSAVLRFGSADESGTVAPHKLAAVPPHLVERTAQGVRPAEQVSWYTGAPPTRDADGFLHFRDHPTFSPNLTPAEVLQQGGFGGYYYRPIASGVTGKVHVDAWKEFPADWFTGLTPSKHLANVSYDSSVNKYKVRSGQDLRAWESSSWIWSKDPFGWFQWYCRFYLGRRCEDDERQIGRWSALCGPSGRWKRNLIAKVVAARASHDDATIAPVVRQTLHHWGYSLTAKHCEEYSKMLAKGHKTSFIREDESDRVQAAAASRAEGSGSGSSSAGSGKAKRK